MGKIKSHLIMFQEQKMYSVKYFAKLAKVDTLLVNYKKTSKELKK